MPRAFERFQVYSRETRGGVEPGAVAEQHWQDIHQDLVHESPLQALPGHVSTEDFEVLPARGVQCRGDRFPMSPVRYVTSGAGGSGGSLVRTASGHNQTEVGYPQYGASPKERTRSRQADPVGNGILNLAGRAGQFG
jgi:hypothetical protein